jgi:ribosomal protein S10
MQNKNLSDKEIRLEILRLVKETGSEVQKNNPLPTADIYYKWINSKTIRKNLTDKRDRL